MLKKLILIVALTVSAFAMHTAEVNINDTDLELNAKLDIGQFNENVEPDTMFIGARFLSADKTHSSNKHYANDPYYEMNFLMMRPVGDSGLSFGMGVKFNYTKDFASMPLGLEVEYKLDHSGLVPMYLNGSAYYGPKVLSFGNAERFYEYRVSYDIELIENGRITIGYRSMNTNYDDSRGDYTYNRTFYGGFKFFF
jgi:hypothetical protein